MITLYTAFVAPSRQAIDATRGVLAKGVAFAAERGIDPATLTNARLAPDMLPLGYQVKSVAAHSVGALDGARSGEFRPDMGAYPTDFAAMDACLADAAAALAAIDEGEVDALIGHDTAFVFGERRVPYLAEDFLLSFSLPNVYFHATTAYDILRANGVPLGKRDYLGKPRFKS